MGIKTSLAAITLSAPELAAAYAYGQNAADQLQFSIAAVADEVARINALVKAIGAGSNATALNAVITALA